MTRPHLPLLDRLAQHEQINYFFTNRIPGRFATRVMRWFSRIEHPLVVRPSLAIWRRFGGDLNLHEAKKTRFSSVHDCFTRELKPGARQIDARSDVLVSPCDAIVAAAGRIADGVLLQAKGFTYTLDDLVVDPALAARHRQGVWATLRLASNMYHRFHAPGDLRITEVIHVPGAVKNVNPIAMRRIDRLYCRNERAVLDARLVASHEPLALVAVGAILVASIRLHFLEVPLDLQYRGPNRLACTAAFTKGDEIGYFDHGSTIIVVGSAAFVLCDGVQEGRSIKMGQPLLRRQPLDP